MYKARKYLNENSLKIVYHDYIYAYLTYCAELWGCVSKYHLNSLLFFFAKEDTPNYDIFSVSCTYRPLIQKLGNIAYRQNLY